MGTVGMYWSTSSASPSMLTSLRPCAVTLPFSASSVLFVFCKSACAIWRSTYSFSWTKHIDHSNEGEHTQLGAAGCFCTHVYQPETQHARTNISPAPTSLHSFLPAHVWLFLILWGPLLTVALYLCAPASTRWQHESQVRGEQIVLSPMVAAECVWCVRACVCVNVTVCNDTLEQVWLPAFSFTCVCVQLRVRGCPFCFTTHAQTPLSAGFQSGLPGYHQVCALISPYQLTNTLELLVSLLQIRKLIWFLVLVCTFFLVFSVFLNLAEHFFYCWSNAQISR